MNKKTGRIATAEDLWGEIEKLRIEIKQLEQENEKLENAVDAEHEASEKLIKENEKLWRFVRAHDAVEKGISDFDLHNAAVKELENARRALEK